jgi:putative tricarboxylic transport membrane protein
MNHWRGRFHNTLPPPFKRGDAMRRHDLLSSIIFFCVGLFIAFYAPRFGIGSLSTPGTGFMPFLTGLIICAFATTIFIQALLDKSRKVEKIWAGVKFQKLVLSVLMLIVYAFLLELLGFIIDSFLLIIFLTWYMGSQTWKKSLLCGVLSSILSYLLFETWLKAQLPRGIFGF